MSRLTYTKPDGTPGEFPLSPGMEEVILGRHPKNPIVLKNPSVSRQHAKVVHENGQYVLYDLGSANGTFMSGQRISRRALSGRRIEFVVGDVPVTFEGEAGGAAQPGMSSPGRAAREEAAPVPREATREALRDVPREASRPAIVADDRRAAAEPSRTEAARPAAGAAAPSRAAAAAAPARVQELERAVDERDAELATTQTRIGELKSKLRRQTAEFEEAQEQVRQLKGEVDHLKGLVEEARTQSEDRKASVEEAGSRVKELERLAEELAAKDAERAEELSNLKIQVVHKDRQLEETRRALDLKEYDVQQLREDMQNLEERFNEDNSAQAELERKINELREIIAEKESHIRDLRQEVDEKDYEIRQVKLGVGMSDLEEERHKLLEDFYNANREVGRLRAIIEQSATSETERQTEVEGLRARVRQLERKVDEKKDITTHPDFRSKVRELERQQSELDDAHATIIDLTKRLKSVNPDEFDAVKRERSELKDRATALEGQLGELRARLDKAEGAAAEVDRLRADVHALTRQLEDARQKAAAAEAAGTAASGAGDDALAALRAERDELKQRLEDMETVSEPTTERRALVLDDDAEAALKKLEEERWYHGETKTERDRLKAELEALQQQLAAGTAAAAAGAGPATAELGAELDKLRAQLEGVRGERDQLRGQLDDADRELTQAKATGGAAPAGVTPETVKRLQEPVESLTANVRSFKSYLRDVEKGLDALLSVDTSGLDEAVQKKLKRHNPAEAMESLKGVLTVLGSDTEAIEKVLGQLGK